MQRNTHQEAGSLDGALPESVCSALVSSAEELAQSEKWVPRRRGPVISIIPRLMGAVARFGLARAQGDAAAYQRACGTALRAMAYFPADLRLAMLLQISISSPDTLDDLITLDLPAEYAPARYNLLHSLGVFARHGLIEEVFTQERVEQISMLVEETRRSQERTEHPQRKTEKRDSR